MSLTFQVVFDCANPDRLARFWAAALGYKLADPPTGFHSWDAFLDSIGVPKEDRDKASAIVDPDGNGPRIFFQRVPEPKAGKNRVHLDVNHTPGMSMPLKERMRLVDAGVERLRSLGATEVRRTEELGSYYVVMLDPEGNEFCAH